MKTILFIPILFVVFLGCKENAAPEKEREVAQTNSAAPCSSCTPSTSPDIPSRLEHEGKIICDLCLFTDIVNSHTIDKAKFDDMEKDYWGTNPVVYREEEWKTIKDFLTMECYEQHLAFKFSATDYSTAFTSMVLEPFDAAKHPNTSYYSKPLFHGIARQLDLCNSDKIKFTKGKSSNGNHIMFKITKNNVIHYFNISHNPGKRDSEAL